MRTPIIIFLAGFLVFLISSLLLSDKFNFPLRLRKDSAEAVVSARAALASVIRDDGTRSRRRIGLGYLDNIYVYPGVKLVHDPALGKEVILSGPTVMVDALKDSGNSSSLHLDFSHPVATEDYLTVTMDLSAHGDYLNLRMIETLKHRSDYPPLLSTPLPIETRLLQLSMVEDVGPIQVSTENLDLINTDEPGKVIGTTHFLVWSGKADDLSALPGLKVTGGVRQQKRDGRNN